MCAERRDQAIARLAGRQHGIVARRQLLTLGLTGRMVAHRVARGRLHVVHRGVYAVGHRALSIRAHWMSSVLAAGPGAVLSHRAAGALHGITASGVRTDVTVPHGRRQRPGLLLHRALLPPDEMTIRDAIPVTTVPRTLLDLAALLPAHRLERAVNEAERLRLWDALSIQDVVDRYPRRPGAPALRHILGLAPARTRSDLEAAFLTFLDAHRLPRPDVNADIDGDEVDGVWKAARLVAELDGHESHGTRAAFERDRARDRKLLVAGWRVVRITSRQLEDDPGELAQQLRILLGAASSAERRRASDVTIAPGAASSAPAARRAPPSA